MSTDEETGVTTITRKNKLMPGWVVNIGRRSEAKIVQNCGKVRKLWEITEKYGNYGNSSVNAHYVVSAFRR